MKENKFQLLKPSIKGNTSLRIPQQEAYFAIEKTFADNPELKEVSIVLPVGCGKSGCITITPFALKSVRALVIAPNLHIVKQLYKDFNPSEPDMFYLKCHVLTGSSFPESAEIRGTTSNFSDLEEADVVITNIQQLQGSDNQWLFRLSADFFDLILFDEAHHNVASTWDNLRLKFPLAKIVNYSATPLRADGQKMAGEIIYSFPVARAIKEGYVKKLKAIVLNPQTLKYVRSDGGEEIEVSLEDVIKLGEADSDFRKSIVTSKETLETIVNASIRELDHIRSTTGDNRHKIIASALNYAHCHQIVSAYEARGRKAGFVHSKADNVENERILKKLENNDLDVIVQVRKLGEGFDHKYLSVAAIFSIFANLSPFVQFVGRIMRVIEQNNSDSLLNQGTVIFHAGSNIQRQWTDFQEFSQADQEYFQQLLPLEGLDFSNSSEIEIVPTQYTQTTNPVEIKGQSGVVMQEIPLISDDSEALKAIEYLRSKGYTAEQVSQVMLQPVPINKQNIRRASRTELDNQIKNAAGKLLAERHINPGGKELDNNHLDRTNFVIVKSEIDKAVNRFVDRHEGSRQDFTQDQLNNINTNFSDLIRSVAGELFNGKN
jgi:superfamily II DNA or RNA helicase